LACQNGRQAKKQAGSLFAGTGEDACLPQCLACQNGRQVKKQAGSLFAGTGEDACLPNDDHYESWIMAEMSAAMILPFRTIAQPDRSSRAACSNASAVT